jgi:ABC-type nitrate/sulfonate/bicarbonate transport system permease component
VKMESSIFSQTSVASVTSVRCSQHSAFSIQRAAFGFLAPWVLGFLASTIVISFDFSDQQQRQGRAAGDLGHGGVR